ncbi:MULTISPECIES: helix-turn-helix domain-containing protein [Mycobacteriaceae]|jgi:hypothetical protein
MRGRDAGLSCVEIGSLIDCDRSVVWREVHTNFKKVLGAFNVTR